MTIGVLLEYLSEIGCGSWAQFRDALVGSRAAPGRPPIWIARDLQVLGHIEFEPGSLRWVVCPPSLVELPDEDGTAAVLCGARSPGFLRRIVLMAEEHGGGHDPDRFSLEGEVVERLVVKMPDRAALLEVASRLGIQLLVDAARRLTTCLPTVQALLEASPEEPLPTGTGVERLVTNDVQLQRSSWLSWSRSAGSSNGSLYRLQLPYRKEYWCGCAPHESRRVTKEVGLYSVLHRLLSYDEGQLKLTFPSEARPPELHLRALVLCSGQVPRPIGVGRLELANIPKDIALTVAKRLGQEDPS